MGTSGSYSGSGSKPGRDLRDGVGTWLDGLPSESPAVDVPVAENPYSLPVRVVTHAIDLILSSGGSRNGAGAGQDGGGRTVGGARRVSGTIASTVGRAAAASYAYITGNEGVLTELGLSYGELRELGDPIEVIHRIVEAACGALSESTISHEEQRSVAACLAEWVLGQQAAGTIPGPEEIVRKAIALIIFEVIMSESGALMRAGGRPAWVSDMADEQVREAAEVRAEQAELSINGVTAEEFSRAIEEGIEALRTVLV